MTDNPLFYMRVADDLRAEIEDGRVKPGNYLPSIAKIVQDTGHSRQTVGRALQIIERERLIRRVPGKGYSVI